MSAKAVVIFSGGMDSFTLLHRVQRLDGLTPLALTFNYGQRHVREIDAARSVCQQLGVTHQVIDLRSVLPLLAGSSLTDDIAIPEGHYADDNMKSTVVPNRNMILLSLAIGYAVSQGAGRVYYGAHGGDHTIYPDCRPEFVARMNEVAAVANYEAVEICAPYLHWDKGQILGEGLAMGLDYGHTWTCYNGRERACGKCGSCVERLEAFASHGVTDPLPYEA